MRKEYVSLQFTVLKCIYDSQILLEDLDTRKIYKKTNIQIDYIYILLRRMEKRKFIERKYIEDDKRRKSIKLTEKGRLFYEKLV